MAWEISERIVPADSTRKRPLSVTLVGWLFIAAGVIGIAYHVRELVPLRAGAAWVLAVRLLAIIGGVFALKGAAWARWLLIGWMCFHVAVSARHSEVAVHVVFLVGIATVLFRAPARTYFRQPRYS